VYHAHHDPNNWQDDRDIFIQPFTFDTNKIPVFGTPIPASTPLNVPSGTVDPERPFLPGDFDANGSVGASDLDVWQDQYGTGVFPGISSDFDGGGDVDGRDFLAWQRQYSAVVPPDVTVAYWRHEEGPSGSVVGSGMSAVLDASGEGNHMRTYISGSTSASYATSVSPLPLRSGLSNNLALDFGPGGDDGGQNDDNYTDGKPIDSQLFSELTVELAFKMNTIGGFQTLVGKDGKPTASAVAPLQIKVRGDSFPDGISNQLFVEWLDGDGDVHFLANGSPIVSGSWNHVAFVLTSTSAALYMVGETGDYALVDSLLDQDFAGLQGQVLISSTGSFTVGRGMYNATPTDWSNSLIDEVRISDRALTESEFLFDPTAAISANLVATQVAANLYADKRIVLSLALTDSLVLDADEPRQDQVEQYVDRTLVKAWLPPECSSRLPCGEQSFDRPVESEDSRDLAFELLDLGVELAIFTS
jgi:hypothetical protein